MTVSEYLRDPNTFDMNWHYLQQTLTLYELREKQLHIISSDRSSYSDDSLLYVFDFSLSPSMQLMLQESLQCIGGVRYAKSLSIRYFIDIDILQNSLINIDIFRIVL